MGLAVGMGIRAMAQRTELDYAEHTDANHNFRQSGCAWATNGDKWVNTKGGDTYFSYDLSPQTADTSKPLYLAFKLWTGDFGSRSMAVYVDGELVCANLPKPVQYKNVNAVLHLHVPSVYWKNADGTAKNMITVKFMGAANQWTMGVSGVSLVQGCEYAFNPADYTTGDEGRVPAANVTVSEDGKSLVVKGNSGVNNIAPQLKSDMDNLYTAAPSCKYLVVCGTGLDTSVGSKSYMWWLNGRNNRASEEPLFQTTLDNGVSYVVWDTKALRVSGNMVGNPVTLGGFGDARTIFGLTSSNEDGSAVLSDIGFYSLTGIAEKYPELAAQMGITLLDEADESFALDTSAPYVAVKRTMKPFVWNTFCVPFDMSADELAANGITSVKSLGAVRRTNGKILLTFQEETGVKSGVPYIVKVADGVTELNIDAPKNVTTAPAEQDAIDGVAMIGNYGKMSIQNGEFFISSNAFYYADHAVTVKGFRAYITNDNPNEVNRMLIDVDGDVTAVERVEGAATEVPVHVYTLSGVCVKRGVRADRAMEGLPRGVYIVNGKKLIK